MYAFWIGPIAVLVFVAATMIRRNLRREFSAFFGYTIFQIVAFLLQFASFHFSYKSYFCIYWISSLMGVVLGFMVIREVFSNLLRPYDALQDLGTVLFRWAAVVLVMVAIMSIPWGAPTGMHRLTTGIFALERSVRVMQCGLVLFMLLFGAHLGVSTKHHVFGVALGFGVFAAVDLIVVTLYALFGARESNGLNLLKSGSYAVSTVVWAYYMLSPEPERIPVKAREDATRWNMALADIQDPQYNFLPMVESVVERVLSKRHFEIEHESKP